MEEKQWADRADEKAAAVALDLIEDGVVVTGRPTEVKRRLSVALDEFAGAENHQIHLEADRHIATIEAQAMTPPPVNHACHYRLLCRGECQPVYYRPVVSMMLDPKIAAIAFGTGGLVVAAIYAIVWVWLP